MLMCNKACRSQITDIYKLTIIHSLNKTETEKWEGELEFKISELCYIIWIQGSMLSITLSTMCRRLIWNWFVKWIMHRKNLNRYKKNCKKLQMQTLTQGSQTQFLKGHSPKEFRCSNNIHDQNFRIFSLAILCLQVPNWQDLLQRLS